MKPPKHKEPFSRNILKQLLPPDAVIVEAGANVGRDTIKLAQLFTHGTIHAFEPVPALFKQLQQNTADYPNVVLYPYALAAHDGPQTMYVHQTNPAISSLLSPMVKHAAFIPEEINGITLTSWLKTYTITRVDFLWLDMQGAELAVLQASPEIMHMIQGILIEVSTTQRYKDSPLYQEVDTWITNFGFEKIVEHLHHGTWGNVLYMKKS